MLEERDQRLPKTAAKKRYRLTVNTKLLPGPRFKKLVQSARATRKCYERVGKFNHACLALMHGCHNLELRKARVCDLSIDKVLWHHPYNGPARIQGGVCHGTHESHSPSAIHKGDSGSSQVRAEFPCQTHK